MKKALSSAHRVGLAVGLFLAIFHALWSVAVAVAPTAVENFCTWLCALHHISLPLTIIQPFVLMNAVVLVLFTLVFGYVLGFIFGLLMRGCGHGKK